MDEPVAAGARTDLFRCRPKCCTENRAGLSTGPSGRNLEIPSLSGRNGKVEDYDRFGLDELDINDDSHAIDENCRNIMSARPSGASASRKKWRR
nr:hypothetical protein [Sphingomonas sp. CDS-1]